MNEPQRSAQKKLILHVCHGKKCTRRGSLELSETLAQAFSEQNLTVHVTRHECFDLCKQGCNLLLELPGHEQRIYTGLHPRRAAAFAQHIADELRAETLEDGDKTEQPVPG